MERSFGDVLDMVEGMDVHTPTQAANTVATLQQAASVQLRYGASRTMRIAQTLLQRGVEVTIGCRASSEPTDGLLVPGVKYVFTHSG